MQRVFGAIAIFAGWLSIGVGAMAGMAVSQFFGLNHVEGDLPPVDVYGVSGEVVLWVFVGAAIVAAVPLCGAMFAADPRRNLRWWAVAMAIASAALLPDALGRAYGLPLLAGAACLAVGGELIHREAAALESARGDGRTSQWPSGGDAAAAGSAPWRAAPYAETAPGGEQPLTPSDSGAAPAGQAASPILAGRPRLKPRALRHRKLRRRASRAAAEVPDGGRRLRSASARGARAAFLPTRPPARTAGPRSTAPRRKRSRSPV